MHNYTWLLLFIPVGLWWLHSMYLRDMYEQKLEAERRRGHSP